MYLETGVTPIKFIIKSRRISYLHHLLTRDKSELISRVFYAQQRKPVKNDWVLSVQNDMQDINLNLSQSSIASMKKEVFKKHLNNKIMGTL